MNLSCPHYPRARQTTSHALSSDPRRCEVEVLRYPILPSTASNGEIGSAQSSRLAIILNGREFTSRLHLLRFFPTCYRLPRSAFTPVSLRLPREESSFPNGGAARPTTPKGVARAAACCAGLLAPPALQPPRHSTSPQQRSRTRHVSFPRRPPAAPTHAPTITAPHESSQAR